MAWVFESSTGKFYTPDGSLESSGYAGGNCGRNMEGINNPNMQNIPKVGPLPEGLYTRGKLIPESHLGKDAIELIPDPSNEMFNRSDFYLHGDTEKPHCASEGCIIQPHPARMKFNASDDDKIKVVARYVVD